MELGSTLSRLPYRVAKEYKEHFKTTCEFEQVVMITVWFSWNCITPIGFKGLVLTF